MTLLVCFGMLLLAIAGCSLAVSHSQSTLAGQNQGNLLFQDDFSSSAGGWLTINQADLKVGYAEGGLKFSIQSPNEDAWSYPSYDFTDSSIGVTATKTGGVDNNDFGILCRYQDADNFYSFLISSDGYFGINKRLNGSDQLLGNTQMKHDDSIHIGSQANQIQADCIGTELTLYVNGTRLANVSDSSLTHGKDGLMAGTFASGGAEILFDQFKVTAP